MLELNESVRFRDVADNLGSSDYAGTFHANDYARSDEKHAERERVLRFILDNAQPRKIKLLSLPGQFWTFEMMLLAEKPHSQVVGLEKSRTVFLHSRRHMPLIRGGTPLSDRYQPYGGGSYVYSRSLANKSFHDSRSNHPATTRSHRLLLMSSDVYSTMFLEDYKAKREEKEFFHNHFYARNSAWLDFTSQICDCVDTTWKNLQLCMDQPHESKPVVVTVMAARDRFNSVQQRVDHLRALQPAFEHVEHWTYIGKGGVPMLTMCGLMR